MGSDLVSGFGDLDVRIKGFWLKVLGLIFRVWSLLG